MVLVEKIVLDCRVLDAVQVYARSSASTVFIDDVSFNDPFGDNTVTPHTFVPVHVDSTPHVVVGSITTNNRAISAVAVVDSMLAVFVTPVACDNNIVGKSCEDTCQKGIMHTVFPDENALGVADIDPVAGGACDFKALDDPIRHCSASFPGFYFQNTFMLVG